MRADQDRASGVGWYLVALSFAIGATPAVQRGHALSAYNAGFMGFVPAGAFVVAACSSSCARLACSPVGWQTGEQPQTAGRVTLPARRSQSAASQQQPRRLTWYRQARR